MKISIGTKIKQGPWGGGNLFALNLKNYLINKGHKVVHNLQEDDIDIILMTEPRKTSESSAFTNYDIEKYLTFKNRDCLVIHRINECDERKMTNYVNKYLLNANKIADGTIYVSSWIKQIFHEQGINKQNNFVVLAGANKEIFNRSGYKKWDKLEKLRIVTHHWGANINKGFSIYKQLDNLLDDDEWNSKIEFKFIGNIPKDFKFNNTQTIQPLAGLELAKELKKSHVYLTASINEPSGNHHIEGAQCGLPLLFINSGGIPEYCDGYGIKFDQNNFFDKLKLMYQNYDYFLDKVNKYPRDSDKMSKEFLNIFEKLLVTKDDLIKKRKLNYQASKLSKLVYELQNRF